MSGFRPKAPGPCAALEAEIGIKRFCAQDPAEKARFDAQRDELWLRAWRGPLAEEDVEWAFLRRRWALSADERHRLGLWAWEGYRESNGGAFEGHGARWEELDERAKEPWAEFGARVRYALPGEEEKETLRAALARFAVVSGKSMPAPSEHWLAALRSVRAKNPKLREGDIPLPPLTPAAKARGAQYALAMQIRSKLTSRSPAEPWYPGPAAARELAIWQESYWYEYPELREDPALRDQLGFELRKVWALAFRAPMPEEDAEWAAAFRKLAPDFMERLRTGAGEWAIEGYLASTGGTFDGNPASRETMNTEAWYAFGERIFRGPPNEDEKEMLEAAIAAYESAAGQKAPPYSEHWVAAYRTIRAKLAW